MNPLKFIRMKHFKFYFFCCFSFPIVLVSQNLELDISHTLHLNAAISNTSKKGTIRWTGVDFEGWNGAQWVSMTKDDYYDVITDIEGNVYRTRAIGNQVWMIDNLRTTRYTDDTPIPNAASVGDWVIASDNKNPAYCWMHNDDDYKPNYGALYNWYSLSTVTNGNKSVCPIGWHLPFLAEISELIAFVGSVGNLKQRGHDYDNTGLWKYPNEGATDAFGFEFLPSGGRIFTGTFIAPAFVGLYWTINEVNGDSSTAIWVGYLYSGSPFTSRNKGQGMAVRCIKD